MPSNNPQFTLRFRTKKQQAAMKRAAKTARFSLNEYIIRLLEDTHASEKTIPQFAAMAVSRHEETAKEV